MDHFVQNDRIIAAADTGPLLSALQCDGVDLIRRYFACLIVCTSQLEELRHHGVDGLIQPLLDEGYVILAPPLTGMETTQAEEIAQQIASHPKSGDPDPNQHLPEAELLIVASKPEHACRAILIDEIAARTVALQRGLNVVGFPGILGRAGLDAVLTGDDIRRMLHICQQSGTHYSNKLIEQVATKIESTNVG